jgi:vesicle-associated membrane protein 7
MMGAARGAPGGRIVYSLVAVGRKVLCEFTAATGNFPTIARVLLGKISPEDGKMAYVYDSHVFSYVVSGGVTYLCLSDEELKHRQAFSFLEDVMARFKATYPAEAAHAVQAFAMQDEFSDVLRAQMEHHSRSDSSATGRVLAALDDVRGMNVENIEKLLQRGEKIELLVDRSETMQNAAFKFERSAKQLRDQLWWKNARLYGVVTLVVLFVLFFIIATACGGLDFAKCS